VATGDRGTSGMIRWRKLAAATAAGLLAGLGTVVGLGTPAAAHGQFVSSVPVDGSEVTEPLTDLFLYFTEKPTSNAYFAVTAPSGARVDRLWSHGPTRPLDPPVHEWYHEADGDWVTRAYSTAYSARIPIAYWPEVGEYTVEYISVATDGQPVRGQLRFTYSGAVSPLPADFRPQRSEPDPNLLAIAAADAPTAPPSGPPIQEVIERQEAGPGLWVLWVPLGLALAAALAIVVFWRLRPEQARALVVSRFGGRYAAPSQRRRILPPILGGRTSPALPAAGRAAVTAGRASVPAPAPSVEPKPAVEAKSTGEPKSVGVAKPVVVAQPAVEAQPAGEAKPGGPAESAGDATRGEAEPGETSTADH
jgi:methionine-rich copper-binding protein CopC